MDNIQTNIVIFGKNGQVGSNLIRLFAKESNFNINAYSSKDVDFTDLSTLDNFLNNLSKKPDFIINAAAYTNVDKAEEEQELADLINHQAVAIIAKYCKKNGTKLIHYSTDYVFDGSGSEPFTEDNTENLKPLNHYGKTKLLGEQAIINSCCNHIILRISWVYDNNPNSKNFVNTITKLAKERETLNIVNDQIGSPTSADFVAENTIKLIKKLLKYPRQSLKEIYHLNNGEYISWYQFALKIINGLRKNNKDFKAPKIRPIKTIDYKTIAIRPLNSRLRCKKIWRVFNQNWIIRSLLGLKKLIKSIIDTQSKIKKKARIKILFVAMAKSSHTVRFVNQVNSLNKYKIGLFSSYNLKSFPKRQYKNLQAYLLKESRYFLLCRALFNIFKKLLLINVTNNRDNNRNFIEFYLWIVIKLFKPDIIHSLHTQNSGYLVSNVKKYWFKNKTFPKWINSVWGSDLYLYGKFEDSSKEIKNMLSQLDYFLGEGKRDNLLATQLGFSGKFLDTMPASGGFDLEIIKKIKKQNPSLRKEIAIKGYEFGVGMCRMGLIALSRTKDLLEGYTINIFSSELDQTIIKLYEAKIGIKINVIPYGSHETILQMFSRSRLFIGLSLSDGLPSAFLEAMALGAFPIQSNTSVADEWIEDGKTGILVPPEDLYLIEQSIRTGLKNDRLVDNAAIINLNTIKEKASLASIKQKMALIYDNLL
jgi:dTDP-4-dehydrorhamnose reductase